MTAAPPTAKRCLFLLTLFITPHSWAQPAFDLLLHGGLIYDGSGGQPITADIGINADRITSIGDLADAQSGRRLDISGLAVAPGFINMLSWATDSLLIDGRSQSDIRQGVTLEVFGEGMSMGPINEKMRAEMLARQDEATFDIPWTTLGEYLEHLERRGVSPNVASFVGATAVRVHELGYANRAPTPGELDRMRGLVAQAMADGALGLGSALIYAPAFYARTDELIALTQVVAQAGGTYVSHMRSEGNRLLESIDELITIAEAAGTRGEIYHFKVSGRDNWHKFDDAVARVEAARARGLDIGANMYTYTAGSTGLDAAMPPWVQEGGYAVWSNRLRDPAIRSRVAAEMKAPSDGWENLMRAAGADNTLLVGFRNPDLRPLSGKTLADVARSRGTSVEETAMDLVVEDGSRVQVVYFLMSEENVRKTLALPWVSFGSDAGSMSNSGTFILKSTHPRAYGNFARVLGKYSRDEGIVSLAEAVRKLSALPADNLKLRSRGRIEPDYYADLAVFDPARVQDHASYDDPHQYATGMVHVFVNGQQVLQHGEHTGRLPGRVVRGPGWRGWHKAEQK